MYLLGDRWDEEKRHHKTEEGRKTRSYMVLPGLKEVPRGA